MIVFIPETNQHLAMSVVFAKKSRMSLMGFELTLDSHLPSQTCQPLHHAAPLINQLYHILCHCQTL